MELGFHCISLERSSIPLLTIANMYDISFIIKLTNIHHVDCVYYLSSNIFILVNGLNSGESIHVSDSGSSRLL